ncbi:MAG: hypothetical protein HXY35_15750 [Chloroflexi bacterium]|nr:hypothetical protein [Chloroflexota bacterium]
MPEEKKEPPHPEVTFLPPLQMVLSFLDEKLRKRVPKKDASDEKTVEKLIEKLSEKDE